MPAPSTATVHLASSFRPIEPALWCSAISQGATYCRTSCSGPAASGASCSRANEQAMINRREFFGIAAGVTALAAAGAGETVSHAQQKPSAADTDWSQWRGPRRDGSVDAALPAQWPEALKKRWEIPVGTGHASPVVSGNRVVVIAREGDQ